MKLVDFLKIPKNNLIGKVVCFPTDTVYGVGCMIEDTDATKKIYEIKRRDLDKPLAVLVSSIESIKPFVENINIESMDLMKKYWPGALTIIFDKKQNVSIPATNNMDTIGIRMPNSKIALDVLNHLGPMATTSVNISGSEPLNDLSKIKELFKDKIDYYIEDVPEKLSKVSSTVVKINNNGYIILRQGDIKL